MDIADRIAVSGIRARGFHGVYPDERRDGQDFVVDVVMDLDTRRAAETDDVLDTVHYGEVTEAVAAVVSGDPVDLIETLAARIAIAVLAFQLVEAVTVTVHKPDAPIPVPFADVTVTIHRRREQQA
ncbi:dihydroneopterin aldolase [Microbacterium sp. P03]|uniref:dihydroneopterin aldolase n=1 Tax=Microbacterium sp. P03 TaxID=3366946 RepID=UPI00374740C6